MRKNLIEGISDSGFPGSFNWIVPYKTLEFNIKELHYLHWQQNWIIIWLQWHLTCFPSLFSILSLEFFMECWNGLKISFNGTLWFTLIRIAILVPLQGDIVIKNNEGFDFSGLFALWISKILLRKRKTLKWMSFEIVYYLTFWYF